MKKIYSGTVIILHDKYNNLFNKNVLNINKEILILKKKFKFVLNQFKILNFKINKKLNNNTILKNNINNIIYILEKRNILIKSIYLIKNKSFSYIKSLILILNYELNNNIKNYDYKNNIIYIGNFFINITFNELNLQKNSNINENVIIIMENLSLLYIIKFIFINIVCIIIKNNNFNKNYILMNNFYVIFIIKNLLKYIKNNDYLIIDYLKNKIYVNPSSIKINNIINNY